MKIEILSTGCPKCKKLYENVNKILDKSGITAEINESPRPYGRGIFCFNFQLSSLFFISYKKLLELALIPDLTDGEFPLD